MPMEICVREEAFGTKDLTRSTILVGHLNAPGLDNGAFSTSFSSRGEKVVVKNRKGLVLEHDFHGFC